MQADDVRLARPVFTLNEAALYIGLPPSTMHTWARPAGDQPPVVTCLPKQGREATVPFIGFAEAYVLSAFRRAGVPMQRIRPAVQTLAESMGFEHALASRRLYTDGAAVLHDYAHDREDVGLLELTVVRTGQKQFSELVREYLHRPPRPVG